MKPRILGIATPTNKFLKIEAHKAADPLPDWLNKNSQYGVYEASKARGGL